MLQKWSYNLPLQNISNVSAYNWIFQNINQFQFLSNCNVIDQYCKGIFAKFLKNWYQIKKIDIGQFLNGIKSKFTLYTDPAIQHFDLAKCKAWFYSNKPLAEYRLALLMYLDKPSPLQQNAYHFSCK